MLRRRSASANGTLFCGGTVHVPHKNDDILGLRPTGSQEILCFPKQMQVSNVGQFEVFAVHAVFVVKKCDVGVPVAYDALLCASCAIVLLSLQPAS